jgi:hypothetical protein
VKGEAEGRAAAKSVRLRAAALLALVAVAYAMIAVLLTAYHAASDAFIAPIIFSPDNDLVLQQKQKIIEITAERELAEAQLESAEADLAADAAEQQRLMQMGSLQTGDLDALDQQRALLEKMYDQARVAAAQAARNFTAGLIAQSDYNRSLQELHQAQVGLLENRRSAMRSETTTTTGPEIDGQRARLDLLKVYAAKKAKIVEQKVLENKIEKLRDLEAQLRERPIALAMEKSLDAAFVPYTQLDRVQANRPVYACVWGLFWCAKVGQVTEVVPGEVNMADPWGTLARGQYVLLSLQSAKAAREKVLRVR